MFSSRRILKSPLLLFIASFLVVFGVFINRFNNFVIAYTPPYTNSAYYPSFGEVSIAVGFVAIQVLLFRAGVMIFPVISRPKTEEPHNTIGDKV